ncbi:MAG TPA: tetratricopeptide repeat protein [Rhizomicrobium sp.]|jgi:tetratricopeptide (TPR) repeat protein|nr:tetratricopeptide repeat protein [Rhizomicrobium sp.]
MPSVQRSYEAGLAHFRANRFGEAESCFRAAVAADPRFATGYYMLGVARNFLGAWQAASDAFRSAIAVEPRLARAHVGLGSLLERMGRIDEAETHLRQAIALDPELNLAFIALAELLRGEGKLREARARYDSVLARAPQDRNARFGRGVLNLLEGDLESGWNDYEYRVTAQCPPGPALAPRWRGEDPADKTLLLYSEQGLGDTIQFLRYATLLAKRGARIIVSVPATLVELASRVDGVHQVVPDDAAPPAFDYCAPLPSLPLYCRTTLASIPWNGPYLSPPPGRSVAIPPNDAGQLTVALAWAGSSDNPYDYNRSLTASRIEPLFGIGGVRWLILQRGARAEAIEPRSDIVQLGDRLDNFSDIAAVIGCADLTISVDTSFCHLAGAMGCPVWTLLSYVPDWRWLLQRPDSPWYPSMRLFRQASPRDWAGVIAAVSRALVNHGKLFG